MTFVFAGSHFLILEKLKPKKENEDIYKKKIQLTSRCIYLICYAFIQYMLITELIG